MSKCCGHDHACHSSSSTPVADVESPVMSGAALVLPVAAMGATKRGEAVQTRLRILQMDCPVEEKLLRDKLTPRPDVMALSFNLMQRMLIVTHAPEALPDIIANVQSLGFSADEVKEGSNTPVVTSRTGFHQYWTLLLSGGTAFAAEIAHYSAGHSTWLVALLALISVAFSGVTTYRKGWIALVNFNLNINALMSIAVTGAMLIGQWPEAAMVMFLFAVAERIEARSLERARQAIQSLMALTPVQATLRQADGGWRAVPVSDVVIGAILRVRPGERLGLDGMITRGQSALNQAAITGESLPVDKTVGDQVFAGTLNQSGEFEYRVTALADHSMLARIIHAVEEAQNSRAPTQRFVDQFARIYTPAVVVMALMIAVIPPLLFAAEWLVWIYRALVLLVVACPCALVISTPVTIVSGLTVAARNGILIKGGAFLERGRKLSLLALDKTGTVTHGRPELTDSAIFGTTDPVTSLQLAVTLANRSDHPVSLALVRAATSPVIDDVQQFTAYPGRGIEAAIEGHRYRLGNHRWIETLGLCAPAVERQLHQWENQGKTVVLLANEQAVMAAFAVADTVKPGSRAAVQSLRKMGIASLLLTGDNANTAKVIAAQVGIDQVQSDLLPEEKLSRIETAILQGECVGMVGDGINDAPALARADIGFAMGAAGTDTAMETADVALMDDDLRKVADFVHLSRQTVSILRQNMALALGIKAVFFVLTLMGDATLWMAVFADMGASLLVVANGLRLLRFSPSYAG